MTSRALRGVGLGISQAGQLFMENGLAAMREEGIARMRAESAKEQAFLEDGLAEGRNVREAGRRGIEQDKLIAANAAEGQRERAFKAGEPNREAAGKVAEMEGLLAFARKHNLDAGDLLRGKDSDGKSSKEPKFVDVQERGVDGDGNEVTVTKTYLEVRDPKSGLPRRIPKADYEAMLPQIGGVTQSSDKSTPAASSPSPKAASRAPRDPVLEANIAHYKKLLDEPGISLATYEARRKKYEELHAKARDRGLLPAKDRW